MTPTITQDLSLWKVHRHRYELQRRIDRNKTFAYIGAIAVGIAVVIWDLWR